MYRVLIYCTTVGMAITALFSMPRPALAAVILQKSVGTPLPQGNLVQYTISAVGTVGEEIDTFSAPSISPVSGLGIHNVAQAFSNAGTPTKSEHNPGLWYPDWAAYDTYFMFGTGETLSIGPNFSETNNGATTGTLGLFHSTGGVTPTSGFGTYMAPNTSSKIVLAPHADSDVPFMQVVLRAQDSARLVVSIVAGNSIAYQEPIIIGPFVPEPSTIVLLAVSAAGLITSRRVELRRKR
jgi:hypothetical protein